MSYGPIMKTVSTFYVMLFCLLFVPFARAEKLSIVTMLAPPLAYEQDGKVVGAMTDVVREGLRRMGLEADITITPWRRALHMTQEGEADAIFQAGKNADRQQWFHYPEEPLYAVKIIAVKRTNESILFLPDRYDYTQYTLGMVRGYYFGPHLESFLKKARFKKKELVSSPRFNFTKLAQGRIDMLITNIDTAQQIISEPDFRHSLEIITGPKEVPIALDEPKAYLAFSKKNMTKKIADKFSNTLKAMKRDGTYDRILSTYYPSRK